MAVVAVAAMSASAMVATAAPSTASPAGAGTGITVNLADSTGAVGHGATGFLYGLGDEGVPGDTMLTGLSHLGIAAQMAPDGRQHPSGDILKVASEWRRNGGQALEIYMQDIYSKFPYEQRGLSDYLAKIDTMMPKMLADPNHGSFIYVPFNEPDWIWYSGNLTGFENDWRTVYQRIRALDPHARIAGPNFSAYNAAEMRGFMTFAKANNVLPDVTTWHELDGTMFSSWYSHYNDYRQIEKDLRIARRRISINEYGRSSGDLSVPGNLVQYVARFENSKVDGSLAYWDPAGNLDDLVSRSNQADGAWWLYNWYGMMSGSTVGVTLPDPNQPTQAIASYDPRQKQARVLLGGNQDVNGTYSTTVSVTGLSRTAFRSGAHVTVWGVDATGTNPSSGPYVVSQADMTASNGAIRLPLTDLKGSSAYYAVLTPARGSAATTAHHYEAEYARLSGAAAPSYSGNGFSGGGYVTEAGRGAGTTFYVTSPANGYYDVSLRYRTGTARPGAHGLSLTINGDRATSLALPATGRGSQWRTATTRLYLPAGINRVDVAASASRAVVDLDYLRVDPVSTVATTYEAESSANTLSGTAVVASDVNASGGKLVGFIGDGAANTLRFNGVVASRPGDYTLVLRYAQNEIADSNAYQIVDRFADVSVDGGAAARVAFANTRSWSAFWTASVRVHLDAGVNTVTIGNASAWAPNIDSLTVGRTVPGMR